MDEKILWSIGFVMAVVLLGVVKPKIGRIFLGIFYLIMATAINIVNALTDPLPTIQMGEESLLAFYRTIFTEFVSKAPVLFILIVAFYQIVMGMLILGKHRSVKIGLIGASVFLLFITPFGYIQFPWLGIAGIQLYLLRYDYNKSFMEMLLSATQRIIKPSGN